MDLFQQARRLAEQTPVERNRVVDFLRVAALSVVVIGHWLVIDVTLDNGLPTGSSALASLPPVWIGLLALALVPVLVAVTSFERPPARLEDVSMPTKNGTAALILAGAGVAAASRGLTIMTTEGFWAGQATAPPLWGLASILAGLALVVVGGGLGREPSDRPG